MKKLLHIFFRILPVYIFILYFYGCGSSNSYPVTNPSDEIKPDLSRSSIEIREDIKLSTKSTENKFTDKNTVSKTYTIQLGSFKDETNAEKMTNRAKKILFEQAIDYKIIDGLFKVRTGNYNSLENAVSDLLIIKQAGYNDSYVLEIVH